jgi:hypothetical protein
MTSVILAELAVAAVLGVVFCVAYLRSPWLRSAAGRHMMAVSVAMSGEAASLLALGLGLHPPMWLFAAGYACIDVVVAHRLVLLWRARRLEKEAGRAEAGARLPIDRS